MSIEDYEVVIGLEVHCELSTKTKYSVLVLQNSEENQIHIAVLYVWQCQERYQY